MSQDGGHDCAHLADEEIETLRDTAKFTQQIERLNWNFSPVWGWNQILSSFHHRFSKI